MTRRCRRFLRSLLLVFLATGLAACHFCGPYGHMGFGHHWAHAGPVRHCR